MTLNRIGWALAAYPALLIALQAIFAAHVVAALGRCPRYGYDRFDGIVGGHQWWTGRASLVLPVVLGVWLLLSPVIAFRSGRDQLQRQFGLIVVAFVAWWGWFAVDPCGFWNWWLD